MKLNIPKAVYIYDEGIEGLDFKGIRVFIHKHFDGLPARLIKLKERIVHTRGIIFDLLKTKQAFDSLESPRTKNTYHIILTDKIFATIDEDKRPHIRAAIFSYPCIISTSGIVEGPAKPKEYYLYKQKYTQLGIWDIEEAKLKKKFKGRFIDYQDKRMNEVLKGYIAQGLFFYISQEPFCKHRSCRLYNAHWQEDLIYSQITCGEFCKNHKAALEKFRKFYLT